MVLLASAVEQEEGDGVVIHPVEVVGKGKQDGGTTVPAPHQPVLTPDTAIYSFLPSPTAYALRCFIK